MYDNLIYDYQAFSITDSVVKLEKGLEIKLPKQLIGKRIKQVEIIPKFNKFHAVFVYEEDSNDFEQVPESEKVMSIDLPASLSVVSTVVCTVSVIAISRA